MMQLLYVPASAVSWLIEGKATIWCQHLPNFKDILQSVGRRNRYGIRRLVFSAPIRVPKYFEAVPARGPVHQFHPSVSCCSPLSTAVKWGSFPLYLGPPLVPHDSDWGWWIDGEQRYWRFPSALLKQPHIWATTNTCYLIYSFTSQHNTTMQGHLDKSQTVRGRSVSTRFVPSKESTADMSWLSMCIDLKNLGSAAAIIGAITAGSGTIVTKCRSHTNWIRVRQSWNATVRVHSASSSSKKEDCLFWVQLLFCKFIEKQTFWEGMKK